MKRLYVAIAFLLVCIGLCTYEQILIEEVYKTSTNLIDIAIDYADDEKYKLTHSQTPFCFHGVLGAAP